MGKNRQQLNTIRNRLSELSRQGALSPDNLREMQSLSDTLRTVQTLGPQPEVKANPAAAKAKAQTGYKPKRGGRKGKKLTKYQSHISECTRGYGKYNDEGTKPFMECVAMWRTIKHEDEEEPLI
jgi:hypothetical protein